jgi:molybdopterin synthase sulfur carrier subunit
VISVRLRFFAALREQLGAIDHLQLPAGATVGQARDALLARGEREAAALARGRAIRAARNQVLCDEATVLADGDELAFFPPVTGG